MAQLVTGVYHLSRRKAVGLLSDILGVRVSLWSHLSAVEARVSDAVQPAVDAAWERVAEAEVKHTDGCELVSSRACDGAVDGRYDGKPGSSRSWPTTPKIRSEPLYRALRGIRGGWDRAKALNFWAAWSGARSAGRIFFESSFSFSERDGPADAFGQELLDYTGIVFDYWHDRKAGRLSREKLIAWMVPVRQQMKLCSRARLPQISRRCPGSCADILEHRAAMWTFVDTDGVANRRITSTPSAKSAPSCCGESVPSAPKALCGNVFAENLMTVAHCARKRARERARVLYEVLRRRSATRRRRRPCSAPWPPDPSQSLRHVPATPSSGSTA